MQWFYVVDGAQVGPIDEAELKRILQDGTLPASTLVWHAEMGAEWKVASAVNGLITEASSNVFLTDPKLKMRGEVTSSHVEGEQSNAWQSADPIVGSGTHTVGGGQTPNKELMRLARLALDGRWGFVALVGLAFFAIIGIANQAYLGFLISGAMSFGLSLIMLNIIRNKKTEFGQLFSGFNYYVTTLVASFLVNLYMLLWMILFIIPGIIAAYSYSLTFLILVDNPELKASEAISLSKQMMHGYKMKKFELDIRFIGWNLLCAFGTFGIGYIWLFPYMSVSYALFYEDLVKGSNLLAASNS